MIEIEIDGQLLEVSQGAMIIEAADKANIKIPRFCYHKKLSIAANCRMCLVDVEKAPKPLPACATPVTSGMKVFTQSAKAQEAQKSVMEFLLINHPLDCPICDQGGSCELQDISLEYGNDFSRYEEPRRSVKDENLGSLIATEMTRCIQCTRCVRFGQEIAGVRELGTIGRGDRMEIGSYLKSHAITSEISGNIIDLCPVGALTSKPFRFTARAWELQQVNSIAPHDSLGANLYLHIHQQKVMRVVPKENEEINETWISDRDRFSYEGLYSDNRLKTPLIKQDNQWRETDWPAAIDYMIKKLEKINPKETAAMISPNATLEECYLLQKWLREWGCDNIDHRVRETDADKDQNDMPFYPDLGVSISALQDQDLIIIIGSHICHENPLIAQRIRKAYLQGAKILCINPVEFEFAFDLEDKHILSPQNILDLFAQDNLDLWENYFKSAEKNKKLILLGELAFNHPHAASLRYYIKKWAQKYDAVLGYMTTGANTAGAWIAGAVPHRKSMGELSFSPGYSTAQALKAKLRAYILFNLDPWLDIANPVRAQQAFQQADCVIAFSGFKTKALLETADIILPIGLYAENAGTYVNLEGQWQSFESVVPCMGEARPAWKILRVLGGFSYQSLSEIQVEIKKLFESRSVFHQTSQFILSHKYLKNSKNNNPELKLETIIEWPIYRTDMLVRHAAALQHSPASEKVCLKINPVTAEKYKNKIININHINLNIIKLKLDSRVPENCVWIPAGFEETTALTSHD